MSLGKKLKLLREERKLSQYEVAEKLNIQRGRYNSWENDFTKPRLEMLETLCDFYNVSTNELLGDIETLEESSEIRSINRAAKRMTLEERKEALQMIEDTFAHVLDDEG